MIVNLAVFSEYTTLSASCHDSSFTSTNKFKSLTLVDSEFRVKINLLL